MKLIIQLLTENTNFETLQIRKRKSVDEILEDMSISFIQDTKHLDYLFEL